MSLTNDSKTNIALKTLLGKAHTDNLKNLGNESEGAFINLPANKIFADNINEDPLVAESEGVVMKITASLVEDATSNGHSYFAIHSSDIPALGIVSGDRVKNAVSPSFGYRYEAKPYDGAFKIAVDDPKNWIYQYETGIYYQQNVIGSIPEEIELYIYTGGLLSELGENKANISGDNIENQNFNDNLKTYITTSIDIYVTSTGEDETGDGSIGLPYATYERALKDLRYSVIKNGAVVTVHLDNSSFEITETSTKYLSTINCIDSGQLIIEGSTPTEEVVLSSSLADLTIPFKYTVTGIGYNATSDFYSGYFIKNTTDNSYHPISSSGSNFVYTTLGLDLTSSSIYSLSTTLTSSLENPFGNLTLGSKSIIFKNIDFDFSIDTILYTEENKGIELNTCKLNKPITATDFIILNFTKTYLNSIKIIDRGILYLKNSSITDLQAASVPYHDIFIDSTVFYKTTLDEGYFIDSNCYLKGSCLFKSNVINENVFTLRDTIKGKTIYIELDNSTNLIKYENFQNITFVFDNIINYKETNEEITANTDVSINRYILINSYNSQYYLEHIIGYETKAEIYSLNDPIVYCRENNKIYIYNESASEYTVDNEYVLNTLLGGNTRYLATDFAVVKTNTDRVLIDYLGNTIDTITVDNINPTALSTGALDNDKITTQGYVDDLINTSIASVIKLQGSWDASTNDPDILSTPETGFAWRVSINGTTNVGGITDWRVGDLVVKTNSGWIKIDNEDISAVWGNISGTITDQEELVSYITLTDGSIADSLHRHEELNADTTAKIKVNGIDIVEVTETEATANKVFKYNSDKSSEYTSRALPDFGGLTGMFENKGELSSLRELGLSQGNINDIGLFWSQSPTPGAINGGATNSQNAFSSFCDLGKGIVLAGSYNYDYGGDPAGIWKSYDYGKTFNQYVRPGLDVDYFPDLICLGNGIVLAGSSSEAGDGDVWRSIDYGDTWIKYEMGPDDGINPNYTSCRAFCDLGNGVILTGTGGTVTGQGNVYKSLDYGLTWSRVTDDTAISALSILNIIYLGSGEVICSSEDKIYRSTDYGDTWNLWYTSIDGYIYSLFYTGSGLILIGTGTSIIKSYNKGLTWESFPAPNQVRKITYVGSGVMFFCASGSSNGASIYKSTDDGSTWTEIIAPFSGDRDYALGINYIGNSILLVGVGDPDDATKTGIYRSVIKEPVSEVSSSGDAILNFTLDGQGGTISTGQYGCMQIPFDCTIESVTLVECSPTPISGSIVVDIWKSTYDDYPATVADSITASAKPTLSSTIKYTDSTLTGWTTSLFKGDLIWFNVDSASIVQKIKIFLAITSI